MNARIYRLLPAPILAATVASVQLFLVPANSAAGTIYDLAGDWSDATNPNGVWSYNYDIGAPITVHQTSWDPIASGSAQPAWAFQAVPTAGHIPAWFNSVGNTNIVPDAPAGTIVVHTADAANGVAGLSTANVTWTSPIDGMITIVGDTWLARKTLGRSDDWSILLNGSTLASGTVTSSDPYTSSNPLLFPTLTETVHVGDVVMFAAVKDPGSPFGEFEAVNLTIDATAVPEPASLFVFGGLGAVTGLAVRWRRKRRCERSMPVAC